MMQWLTFSMSSDGKHVAEMKCKSCCKFRERLDLLRNYCRTFINGTDNLRLSAVVDHAKSPMRACVMDLYHIKTQALVPVDYTPIARAFAPNILYPVTKECLLKERHFLKCSVLFSCKRKAPVSKVLSAM